MIAPRLFFAVMLTAALPILAQAQDAPPADPMQVVQGIWRVDRVEGNAATDAVMGSIIKVERQAIASFANGTCSSPGFTPTRDPSDPKQQGVDITCLGQVMVAARWNTDDPGTMAWSERDLELTLHRVTSASAPQPAQTDQSPQGGDGDQGEGEDAE